MARPLIGRTIRRLRSERGLTQQVIEQRRLARTEKTGEDRDGNAAICLTNGRGCGGNFAHCQPPPKAL